MLVMERDWIFLLYMFRGALCEKKIAQEKIRTGIADRYR
jgi:hypothetical protein